ncbi:polycomb group protein Psc [Anopheles aquasalis]|uniref:polycomb group protein Psc n=1 Tax=Anopheles aquasalis TaxID=42839 RepID=UPI00215A66D4|nr:polycomb group protein Psc [Anopheles aquasalis]
MVLLPNPSEDVLAGGSPSASTELASEGTPKLAKVVSSTTNATPPSQSPVVVVSSTASVMSGKDSSTVVVVPAPTNETTTGDDVTETSSSSSSSSSTSSTRKALSSYLARPLSPYRPSHAQLSTVNPCITCNLCKGYLIDATTIVECLHSFCHSCIMKHLRTEQYCPQCEMMINKAKPNIKPDATLQAIVYKLVPGLYENELRRRRAFYRQHPEMAAIATPEQRGDDTEHLIFGPNEKISLSLEYAEKELAQDNEELLTPKYLLCPALFSIAHLKKFIIFKYGISERQFCVEIMYKVKTIILPDYYTLMDVAYIYTWKRDAPMKYFYRIRTIESYPEELTVDMPLRRTPSISSQSQESYRSNEEDDKENIGSSGKECKQRGGGEPIESKPPRLECSVVGGTPGRKGQADQPASNNGSSTPTVSTPATTVTVPSRKNEAIKLKIELNKNKYVSFLQSPQADIPVRSEKPEKVKRKKTFDGGSPASAHHHRRTPPPPTPSSVTQASPSGQGADLKIKIEKIKYATPKDGKSGKKSSPPYKVELSPGLSQGLSASSASWEVEEPKKSSSRSSLSLSKKLKLSKSSTSLEVKHPIVLKIDQRSPDMATSTLKFEVTPKVSPKSKATSPLPTLPPLAPSPPAPPKFEDEQSQFLNSFQLAPIKTLSEEAESKKEPTGKQSPSSAGAAAASEPPKKASSPTSTSPSSTPSKAVNGGSSVTANGGVVASAKRKAKEPAQRPDESTKRMKKPKLSDEEMKAMVEQKVAENINSPRGCIVPPIFFRPTVPSVASSPASRSSISPPAGDKPLDKKPRKPRTNSAKPPMPTTPKRDSPRPFVIPKPLSASAGTPSAFMPPPPPPIVSATNIPAVKPSQQVVVPVPILLKPEVAPKKAPASSPMAAPPPPKVATVPTASQPSLLIPNRRPTMPTKLPTSHAATTANTPKEPTSLDTTKPKKHALELKRAQSNPSVNIIPPTPRDTEISKLRPEDIKKNAKVYGPPEASPFTPPKPVVKTDAAGFVVPTKTAPKPATGSSSNATTGANSSAVSNTTTTTSSTNVPAGPGKGARPVNYLNYALYNSKAAPAGSRTPIPSYSISSPSYSPDSPQYSPNFNISTKQYKYVNPLACTNFLQNMLTDRKTGDNISPPLPSTQSESAKVSGGAITVSSATSKTPSPPLVPVKSEVMSPLKPPQSTPPVDRKRPASAMSPDNSGTAGSAVEPPVDKKPIVQSILAMNIPSSLSITLATEEDEVARQAARKIRESDPANNHIEIVKLPDVPISEVSPKVTPTTSPGSISPPSVAPVKKEIPPKIPTPPTITPQKSNEGFQKKFLESIDVKQGGGDVPVLATTAGMTAPTTSITPPSTGSASKTSNAISSRRQSVGCFPVNRYPEIDLTKSASSTVSSKTSRPPGVQPTGNSAPAVPSPKMLMPPPKMLPLGMKHSPSTGSLGGNQHPKAISPPMPKSSLSPVLSPKPRTHTTPPALPSLASMGPMFGIQMKSDANALQNGAGNGTPMKKPSLPPTLPRRKIVPANNSTSLVPLKTSPPSGAMKPSVGPMGGAGDFITLHPQISSSPQAPQHQHQQKQQQQQQQLPSNFTNGGMLSSVAALSASNLYSNLLNQHQQQQNQQKFYEQFMTDVMAARMYQQLAASQANYGQDSLTITTSPAMRSPHPNLAPYHQLQQNLMNSLTVTAIRSGQQQTAGGNGTAGGNAGGSPSIASNGGARSGQTPKMSTMKPRPGGGGGPTGTPGTGPGANPTKGVS